MKPDFRRLDDVDLEVVNRTPTDEERKEMGAFIQELKRKKKLREQRKAAKKLLTKRGLFKLFEEINLQ